MGRSSFAFHPVGQIEEHISERGSESDRRDAQWLRHREGPQVRTMLDDGQQMKKERLQLYC